MRLYKKSAIMVTIHRNLLCIGRIERNGYKNEQKGNCFGERNP